jgi:NADH dehydrogenase
VSTFVALILWFCVTCYAILGGADYGAGFWDLTAGGPRKGARIRTFIDHSMAPVWEANNVWLIFALVVLWTAFPPALGAITSTLYFPLALAALGIVLRGAGFAFREVAHNLTGQRILGAVFSLSSVLTPFFLGTTFGAIAAGYVVAGAEKAAPAEIWLSPMPITLGLLAVSCAAFLAAVFLLFDARRMQDEELEHRFKTRAIISGVITGKFALAGLLTIYFYAPRLFHNLMHRGLPLVLLSGVCAFAALHLLIRGIVRGTRGLAIGSVVAMLAAWGVGQWPYLLPNSLTVAAGAGAPRTLIWLLVLFVLTALIVIPALSFLFVLDQRSRLQHGVAGEAGKPRHRVVVVGGGFGGLFATKALGWSPVDITLVDREPHHLFQPMLYQLATGIISEGEIAPPLRHVLRNQENAAVLLAEVTGFDLFAKVVKAVRPDGTSIELPFDSLIVAAGGGVSYFGHDELAEHAPGMKTLDDALRLRRQLLQSLEMAELTDDPQRRAGWLTMVIVGAGPTGVEIAGQIRALVVRSLGTSFRRLDPTQVRVLLLDAGKEPLATFGDRLSHIAARELADLGVELRMGVRVTEADAEGVFIETPAGRERIESRTVIWAAGVQASPLAGLLAKASGASCDRAGRIAVQPDCTLPDHPNVFAIGDMVSLNKYPGVAEVAMQQGLYAAKTIRRRVAGRHDMPPFKYHDLGSAAAVGRFRAVVSVHGFRAGGVVGWLAWGFIHLTALTGFLNRFSALAHWLRRLVSNGRSELAYSSRFTQSRSSRPRTT